MNSQRPLLEGLKTGMAAKKNHSFHWDYGDHEGSGEDFGVRPS